MDWPFIYGCFQLMNAKRSELEDVFGNLVLTQVLSQRYAKLEWLLKWSKQATGQIAPEPDWYCDDSLAGRTATNSSVTSRLGKEHVCDFGCFRRLATLVRRRQDRLLAVRPTHTQRLCVQLPKVAAEMT